LNQNFGALQPDHILDKNIEGFGEQRPEKGGFPKWNDQDPPALTETNMFKCPPYQGNRRHHETKFVMPVEGKGVDS
jgi:hypothetical protein